MSYQRQSATKRDKRAFLKMKSGFTYWLHKGRSLRFLTLTGLRLSLKRHCDILAVYFRWIRRVYGRFEYFAVRTDEGEGVYHVVFVGRYMPYKNLREKWFELTGAWNISISRVEDFVYQGFEMTRQKMTARYSCSRKWLPAGLIDLWKLKFRPNVQAWESFLKTASIQADLTHFIFA